MTGITGHLRLLDDTGKLFWTAAECCDHVGVSSSTWSSYVARGQAPAAVGSFDRLRVWDPAEVHEWHSMRRSQRNE